MAEYSRETIDRVRAELERHLGRPVSVDDLRVCERADSPALRDAVAKLPGWIERLAVAVQRVEAIRADRDFSPPPKRVRRAPLRQMDARDAAIAEMLARSAAEDPHVVAFRAEHLPEELLRWEQLADWLEAKRAEDGPPSVVLKIPIDLPVAPLTSWFEHPAAVRKDVNNLLDGLIEANTLHLLDRDYPRLPNPFRARPADFPVEERRFDDLAISVFGVLGALLEAVDGLVVAFGEGSYWSPEQAAAFVLTGWVPPFPKSNARATQYRPRDDVWIVRIEARADAATATVTEDFRFLRDFIFDELSEEQASKRPHVIKRAVSGARYKKHRVALFAASLNDGRTWREAMEAWNREHPGETFAEVKNFIGVAKSGHKDISGEPLRWLSPRSRRTLEG